MTKLRTSALALVLDAVRAVAAVDAVPSAAAGQQVVAVGSRDLGRAQAFVAAHAPGARAHGDYASLVADDEGSTRFHRSTIDEGVNGLQRHWFAGFKSSA